MKDKKNGTLSNTSKVSIILGIVLLSIIAISTIILGPNMVAKASQTPLFYEEWNTPTSGDIHSAPSIADIDGDSELEAVFSTYRNYTYAINLNDRTVMWNYSMIGDIRSTPTIGDINGDGHLEVVFGTTDSYIYALNGSNGVELWNNSISESIESSPALGNILGNNNSEVIIGANGGNVYALNGSNGEELWDHQIDGWSTITEPTLGDILGDNYLEVVFGNSYGNTYALNGSNGNKLWNFSADEDIRYSPAIGDINGDSNLEVVIGTYRDIYALNGHNGVELWNTSISNLAFKPILGDLHGDAHLEVIIGKESNYYPPSLRIHALDGNNGVSLVSHSIRSLDFSSRQFSSAPVNIDKDSNLELIMGLDENYRLYAIEYMFGPKSYVYLGLYGELVFFITFSIVGIILLALIYLAKEFRKPKSDLISSTSKIKKERSSIKKNIYNIETENLTKKYTNRFGKSDVLAVDGIDLLVEDGIHGFLGPNGAGKTSTMKMITGAISITKGTAKVKNYKAGTIKAKRIIGFMPQHVSFYEKMTGKQYLYHSARLAGIKKGTAYKLADDLLTRFELQDAANRQIEKYSGGMKQKLGLAASFISSPEILILDEPTSDLDPIWRNKIISYIKQFSEDTSIFVSSHILPEVEEMCDTVTIINNGNIIMTRSMENLKNLYEEGAYRFIIDTTDNQKLLSFLEGKSFIDQVTIDPTSNMIHVLCKDQIRIGQLITRVGDLNIALKKYTQEETSLKNIFLQLINEENSK